MSEQFDPKLLEGIAYFEKMLQVMPDDRTTLEFLCVAYEQVGELEKQRKAFIALANVLIKENDLDSADRIAERLEKYEESDARAAVLKVRAAHNPQLGLPKEEVADDGKAEAITPVTATHQAVKAERALIQYLVQYRVIDENMAALMMQRLAELLESKGVFLVSALAVLEKENTAAAENAVAYLADAMGMPPIPLENFEVQMDVMRFIPEPLVRVRGVLPFAKMGDTVLVVLINPLDEKLCRQVESAVGGPCRFYLVSPRTLEDTLDKLFAAPAAAE